MLRWGVSVDARGDDDTQRATHVVENQNSSTDREAKLPVVVAPQRFAHGRLERAHRVVTRVADRAAPETRQPIDVRRLPLRERFAQALPRIDAELLLHVAAEHALELVRHATTLSRR